MIRLIRRREILRIALADGAAVIDQDAVGRALADNDRAAVRGALEVAQRTEFAANARSWASSWSWPWGARAGARSATARTPT